MSVCDIHCRNLGKDLGDARNRLLVIDHPERVAEAFRCADKIVLRLALGHFGYDRIQVIAVRVGKEHRFHVRVEHAHMFHTIFLFIASRQLVLLDASL